MLSEKISLLLEQRIHKLQEMNSICRREEEQYTWKMNYATKRAEVQKSEYCM